MEKGEVGNRGRAMYPVTYDDNFPDEGETIYLNTLEGQFDVKISEIKRPVWDSSDTVLLPIYFEIVKVHKLSSDLKAEKLGIRIVKNRQ